MTLSSVHSTTFKGLGISSEPNQTKIHIGKNQLVGADIVKSVDTRDKPEIQCTLCVLYTVYIENSVSR